MARGPGKVIVTEAAPNYTWSSWSGMPDTINLYEAKTNLSKLVERAANGEEIIIAKSGKPRAKLVPYDPPRKKRVFGQNLLGMTHMADDWDGPLPPELQRYFEGESDPEDVG